MSSHADLLNLALFVATYSTAIGAAYQLSIEPGEMFAFVPRFFYYAPKWLNHPFLKKLSSCGKCVAGWIALTTTWFWVDSHFIHLFTTIFAAALAMVATGLINVYVANRT